MGTPGNTRPEIEGLIARLLEAYARTGNPELYVLATSLAEMWEVNV